jgi:hypothetical protein
MVEHESAQRRHPLDPDPVAVRQIGHRVMLDYLEVVQTNRRDAQDDRDYTREHRDPRA